MQQSLQPFRLMRLLFALCRLSWLWHAKPQLAKAVRTVKIGFLTIYSTPRHIVRMRRLTATLVKVTHHKVRKIVAIKSHQL